MSKKLIFIILAVVFAALGFAYVKLGGLNEPFFSVVDNPGYYITGKYYKGHYNDQAIEDIFYEVKQQLKEGSLNGILTIVYYQDPIASEGKVENFIGIANRQKASDIPKGFEQRKIVAGKVVRATIHAHNTVMPLPETVKEKLAAFAREKGLDLRDISIEKYFSDRKLVVEMPVE